MLILASENPTVRQRWQEALERGVTHAESLSDLCAALKRFPAAITFIHSRLEGLYEGEGVRSIRLQYPDARLVIFSDRPEESEGLELLHLGVHGYGNTFMSSKLLRQLIEVVEHGEVWVGWTLLQRLMRRGDVPQRTPAEKAAWNSLSDREKEIVAFVVGGLENRVIGNRLGITERTVKAHVSAVLRKLGLKDRTQLLIYVKDRGG